MEFIPLMAALAAAQLATPAQQRQYPQTTVDAAKPVSRTTAAALARTVAPADVMTPKELQLVRKVIVGLPALDEDAKQLELEYPGIYEAIWTAVEPEMRRSSEADLPSFWAILENLYVARLSEGETQALLAFYRSATGQKLVRGLYENFNSAPLIAEIARTDGAPIDARQLQAATDAAKAKVVAMMGPEDEATLKTMVVSVSLEKFRLIGVEMQKITLNWINKEDPEEDDKVAKMMQMAADNYMAAHPPRKK